MGPKSNTAKKASGLSGAPNSERANNRREIAAAKKAEEEREQTALEEQITVLEQYMREKKIKFHSIQNLHPYEDYDPRVHCKGYLVHHQPAGMHLHISTVLESLH